MIKLTEQQIEFFKTPQPWSIAVSKLLIDKKIYEPRPDIPDYEVAVFMHWSLDLFNKYGEDWEQVGQQMIRDIYLEEDTPNASKS